jgi:putative selenium metabolism protein SsnA
MEKGILIKNGIILTLGDSNRVLYDHSLLIQDGLIQSIAPACEFANRYEKEIDAAGMVVLPGFINAHMHFYSTLVRGLGKAEPAADFQQVLENLWWRLDKKLSLEDTYYSALIMLLQGIKHGCTTFIDHQASPGQVTGSLDEIVKAVQQTGLRASLCYELSDRDGELIAQQGIEENISLIRDCYNQPNEQIKALFGLHASFTISDSTLAKAVQAALPFNAGFHVHAAEAISDQVNTMKMSGQRVVERFADFGVLGRKTIAAHCVHIDEHEMNLLHDSETMVVHNPQSNMNNAVGIADIVAMQKHGILVGLGTDAMTVNMLEELRVALWAQHLKHNNPSVGFMESTGTLLFNNSKIASRYWENALGTLEENAHADVILVPYLPPTPLDETTVLGHLVFGISQHPVHTTIAGGKILMENRILHLNLDEVEVTSKAREVAAKLWKRF